MVRFCLVKIQLSKKVKESLILDSWCLLQAIQSLFQKTDLDCAILKHCWLHNIDFLIKKLIKEGCNDINLTDPIASFSGNTNHALPRHGLNN